MISPTTFSLSWQQPSEGLNVTGYTLSYTDRDEDEIQVTSHSTSISIMTNCKESMNITLQALSVKLPSIPVTIQLILRKFTFELTLTSHAASCICTLLLSMLTLS